MLKGKKIILGITGSIAAYKAAYLLRLLVKEEAEVQVLITPAGKEFITPATLSALSNKPVLGTFFETNDGTWHSHVNLGLWADVMIIAPASANTIAKMATGICDNLLLTTYLSTKCPIFVAPAMDLDMFAHPATQKNISLLIERGCKIIEPSTGVLASGLHGKGRMEEPEQIVEILKDFFENKIPQKSLAGKRVMVTAGPTYENIDPVRFIGNYSSGKTGIAIAEELIKRGAKVDLIINSHLLSSREKELYFNTLGTARSEVISADDMYREALKIFPKVDAAIMTAAVADFKPAKYSQKKIKRNDKNLTIELSPNPDIAAKLGQIKKSNQILIGFALETHDEEVNAFKKLISKNLDFIVLNSPSTKGTGFMTDTNEITIIDKNNFKKKYPLKTKKEVASDIIDELEKLLKK
ncbi:MAG: bifunctional phosphopantothenoylcysteine decarboxylase/phosphopantothenate--cysteine ligase CoaBC [Marinilabiliaceae bacterium]|nr:bifunctional phosphopantothenoylcysteine decarboxylase/phosphopantothenate--cysteine ligase CoaBC [Marinilabiliaceae bacterium]